MRAWIQALRGAILLTAIAVSVRGDAGYGAFCLIALGVTLLPAILVAAKRARLPVALELAVLSLMVADMSLGNLAGLYAALPGYDKAMHLGGSVLVGLIAIHVLHTSGSTRPHPWAGGAVIVGVTLGVGAVWELSELAVDRFLGRATQGAPGLSALDDTLLDLGVDGVGAIVAAIVGPITSAGGTTRTAHRVASSCSPHGARRHRPLRHSLSARE